MGAESEQSEKAPTPSGLEPLIGGERDEEVDPRTLLAAAGEFGYPGHVCRPDLLVPLQIIRVAVSAPSQVALKYIVGGMLRQTLSARVCSLNTRRRRTMNFGATGQVSSTSYTQMLRTTIVKL